MPLTKKGEEILHHMKEEYGEKKGESVFYASANKGTISGVHDEQERVEVGLTLQQINEQNRKLWDVPGGSTFPNDGAVTSHDVAGEASTAAVAIEQGAGIIGKGIEALEPPRDAESYDGFEAIKSAAQRTPAGHNPKPMSGGQKAAAMKKAEAPSSAWAGIDNEAEDALRAPALHVTTNAPSVAHHAAVATAHHDAEDWSVTPGTRSPEVERNNAETLRHSAPPQPVIKHNIHRPVGSGTMETKTGYHDETEYKDATHDYVDDTRDAFVPMGNLNEGAKPVSKGQALHEAPKRTTPQG